MLHDIARFLCAVVVRGIFGLRVEGSEHIPATGGFLMVSNHVSYLDPIVVSVACKRRLRYMARHDLFQWPIARFILMNIRVFPVRRHSADFRALRQALKYVKAGDGLLLFPEGTRQLTRQLGSPLPGAGFIASAAGVPIVPAYVRGTLEALPRGAKRPHLHKLGIRFGPPVRIAKGTSYEESASLIMEAIRRLAW